MHVAVAESEIANMAEVQLLRLVDDLRADLRGDMDMVGDEAHVGMCSMCRKSVRRDDEMCMVCMQKPLIKG